MEKNINHNIFFWILLTFLAVSLIYTVLARPGTRAVSECKDGIDNDGDGYIDWPSDSGCATKNDKTETNPEIECDDGLDNDGDNAADMADVGCSSILDNDETNCGDGICEGGETSGNCVDDCGYPDSCYDTDGGLVPEIIGTVNGYLEGQQYSKDDYCADSTTLIEYFCSGSSAYNWSVNCIGNITTACSDGACV